MTTLVLGASGATGKHLVDQLLLKGEGVKAIARTPENLPDHWKGNSQLEIIKASILEMDELVLANHLRDCDAIASCLGHNINLKGIFGEPKKLVRDAMVLVSKILLEQFPKKEAKILLMNTTGNRNKDLQEQWSFAEKTFMGVISKLIPPQADNEEAAEYLRTEIGQNHDTLKWVAIRPDGLINEEQVSEYKVVPSPTRSAIFNAGKTSRINVGNFMARLITEDDLWKKWQGQMPVIYNQ